MKAREEYMKWCALERQYEPSRYSLQQERAYINGFHKAIELMEKILRESKHESMAQDANSRGTEERGTETITHD